MISRVADHCFWFGRYLERAESTARLLQTSANLALDGDLRPIQVWQPVGITAGEEEAFIQKHGADALADGEAVQEHLALDREVAASLTRSVQAARENARSVREVVSLEVWETINELHLWLQGPAAREEFHEHRYGFYRRVRSEAQLCLGLLRGTMLHDTPLHFIWLGVLIERTGQTARILDVHHHAFSLAIAPSLEKGPDAQEAQQIVEVSLWLSLLRTCYGFEPFMKLHRGAVTGEAAAAFLIFEPRFPRSVRHCVRRVHELLEEVRPVKSGLPARALQRVHVLEEALSARAEERLGALDMHALLTEVVDQMHQVCDELAAELLGPPAPAEPPVAVAPAAALSAGQAEAQTQSQAQEIRSNG